MRRFKFTLQSVQYVKETREKQLRAELLRLNQQLERLNAELEDEMRRFDEAAVRYQSVMTQGVGVAELREYPAYFEYQTEVIEEVKKRIEKAKEGVRECQLKLIEIMKDLKVLENLRQRQYEAYLAEAAAEQQKEIDDFVSYNVSTDDANSSEEPEPERVSEVIF